MHVIERVSVTCFLSFIFCVIASTLPANAIVRHWRTAHTLDLGAILPSANPTKLSCCPPVFLQPAEPTIWANGPNLHQLAYYLDN